MFRFDVPGLIADGLTGLSDGFVQSPLVKQSNTKVKVCRRAISLEVNGLAALSDGFVQLTLLSKSNAEVIVWLGPSL